jgi:glutamine phosphoribosylpyrophosphate amidotransferase
LIHYLLKILYSLLTGVIMSHVSGVFSNNPDFIKNEHLVEALYDLDVLGDLRGQAASGVVVVNETGKFKREAGFGPSKLSIPLEVLKKLGDHTVFAGIGHNCYSKKQKLQKQDIQPIMIETDKYQIAIASDGIVLAKDEMGQELHDKGYRFNSGTNGEFIGMLFANNLEQNGDYWEAGKEVIDFVKGRGGFSASMIVRERGSKKVRLIALRDANAIKPLFYGERDKTLFVNSDTYPLLLYGTKLNRLNGAEMIIASEDGFEKPRKLSDNIIETPCIFEEIYYGTPSTQVWEKLGSKFAEYLERLGIKYQEGMKPETMLVRNCLGVALADSYPGVDFDVLVDVPETGRGAGHGLAVGYGLSPEQILLGIGLTKSSAYRTFQWANKDQRAREVFLKLQPIIQHLVGKRVNASDDSIVYAGMSGAGRDIDLAYDDMNQTVGLVGLMKYLVNVSELIMSISYPPMPFKCFFEFDKPKKVMAAKGMYTWDLPDVNEAIAEKLERHVGGSSGDKRLRVHYQPKQNIYNICGNGYCTACMDGCYPVKDNLIPSEIMTDVQAARKHDS